MRVQHRERGTAAVEFALVAPIMIGLVFGAFEFGRAIMVLDMLDNVARQGARTGAIALTTNADIAKAVTTALKNTTIPSTDEGTIVTITVNGDDKKDVKTAVINDSIGVTVSVPIGKITWLPGAGYLDPLAQLSGTVVMRRE